LCECEYVKWGVWSEEEGAADAPIFSQPVFANTNFKLGTWVAGELADISALPNSGTATYAGHAIGNAGSGGKRRLKVGRFEHQWNFGSRSGAYELDFDGYQLNGTTGGANRRDFNGTISGSGAAGAVRGSLYSGGGDPAAETAGTFHFKTTPGTYEARGVFVGKKQ
jgi:hypothetical protein